MRGCGLLMMVGCKARDTVVCMHAWHDGSHLEHHALAMQDRKTELTLQLRRWLGRGGCRWAAPHC